MVLSALFVLLLVVMQPAAASGYDPDGTTRLPDALHADAPIVLSHPILVGEVFRVFPGMGLVSTHVVLHDVTDPMVCPAGLCWAPKVGSCTVLGFGRPGIGGKGLLTQQQHDCLPRATWQAVSCQEIAS